MSLPNARMSVTLALSANVFYRRAEALFKATAGPNCIPDLDQLKRIVAKPTSAYFIVVDGQAHLDLLIDVRAVLWILPVEVKDIAVRLRLVATTLDADDRVVGVALEYDRLVMPDGAPPLSDDDQAAFAAAMEAALDVEPFELPLAALLADGRAIAGDPELVVAAPGPQGAGDTIVIGVEVEGDPGIDRAVFRSAYASDPLAGGSHAWTLSIDSELMRETIAERIDEIDFTEDSEDGIENWISTTDTVTLWSGSALPDNTYNQAAYIQAHGGDHPVWFFLDGFYAIAPAGVAFRVYIALHADIEVDSATRTLVFVPEIYAVGAGFVPLPIPPEQPAPQEVADAEVADRILVTETAFDAHRLTLRGIDEHAGEPGLPEIQVPAAIEVRYVPRRPKACGFASAQGTLTADGSAIKTAVITNAGTAPLWICKLDCASAGDVFSVQIGDASAIQELPYAIPAGGQALLGVSLAAVDHESHSGTLTIRSNDYDRPAVTIALSGQIEAPSDPVVHSTSMCVRKPELISPQGWFENLNALLVNIGDVVRPGLDQHHELEITFGGLAASDRIDVLDRAGTWLGAARHYGRTRHVSIPGSLASDVTIEAETNARSLTLQLRVSELRRLGVLALDEAPRSIVVQDSTVAIAGTEGISIVSLANPRAPRAIAHIPARHALGLELEHGALVVTHEDVIDVHALDDPYRPRLVTRVERHGATIRPLPAGLAVATEAGTRIYSRHGGETLRLERELPARRALPTDTIERQQETPSRRSEKPFMPAARVADDWRVVEHHLVEGRPTLVIAEKGPSSVTFDVPTIDRLLGARPDQATRRSDQMAGSRIPASAKPAALSPHASQ